MSECSASITGMLTEIPSLEDENKQLRAEIMQIKQSKGVELECE